MEIITLRIIRLPAGKLGFRDIAKKNSDMFNG